MKAEWRIAKIREAWAGFEDHGIFTIKLDLDYGGMAQGAGSYGYGNHDGAYPDSNLYEHMTGIMAACNVNRWDKVSGRTVVVLCHHAEVFALKPLPTEKGTEFWFNPNKRNGLEVEEGINW